MRIGILTFHRAENFGAVLQAWALLSYLSRKGYDVEIIDYRCVNLEKHYDIFNPRLLLMNPSRNSLRAVLYRLRYSSELLMRKKKYTAFLDTEIKKSRPVRDRKGFYEYDYIIVGSDQVWRFNMTGKDLTYFLDFPLPEKTKKIAYSASSEMVSYQELGNDPHCLKCIESFDRISVREEAFRQYLCKYIEKPIETTLDPTLLLNKNDYLDLIKDMIHPDTVPYILLYMVGESEEALALAKKIALEKKKALIIRRALYFGSKDQISFGPKDLLADIAGAETVVTTSFHGLALSLVMGKDVWAVKTKNCERQKSLLGIVGMDKRLVNCADEYDGSTIVDSAIITERLSAVRSFSEKYLLESFV